MHVGINTCQYAEIYQQCTKPTGSVQSAAVDHVSLYDLGGQTTISGSGKIFKDFLESGLLRNFSGYGQKPIIFYKDDFDSASIRLMNLDETYFGMHYDVLDS